jgi:hypothetical protein
MGCHMQHEDGSVAPREEKMVIAEPLPRRLRETPILAIVAESKLSVTIAVTGEFSA